MKAKQFYTEHVMRVGSRKEAAIYFSTIFIFFLGLAYFSPLGCPLTFKFFGQFSATHLRFLNGGVLKNLNVHSFQKLCRV